jgi:hypothetical protein
MVKLGRFVEISYHNVKKVGHLGQKKQKLTTLKSLSKELVVVQFQIPAYILV